MDGVLCCLGVVTEWYSTDMSGISDTGIPNLVASMSLRCLTLNCSVFFGDAGDDALVSKLLYEFECVESERFETGVASMASMF